MGEKFEKSPDAFFSRHSKSGYKSYGKTFESDDPQAPFDSEDQVTPDLTEAGVELAQERAREFFEKLDPEADAVFFVSSDEARALETANIFRKEAHNREFQVVKPDKAGTKVAEQIGEGEIRVVKNLSIGKTSRLPNNVFVPDKQIAGINWDKVDPEMKKRWDRAHALVMADDQGSFGDNLYKHGETVKKVMPEIDTADELYEKQFKKLERLLRWGVEKARKSEHEKKIKIVALGHENYMLTALDKYFDEHSIGNCETVSFRVDDRGIEGEYRSKKADIE